MDLRSYVLAIVPGMVTHSITIVKHFTMISHARIQYQQFNVNLMYIAGVLVSLQL